MTDLTRCKHKDCGDAAVAGDHCMRHYEQWYRGLGSGKPLDSESPYIWEGSPLDHDLEDDPYWFRFVDEEQEDVNA